MKVILLGGPFHGEVKDIQDHTSVVNYLRANSYKDYLRLPTREDAAVVVAPETYNVRSIRLETFFYGNKGYHCKVAIPATADGPDADALVFRALIAPQYQSVFEK